MIQSFINYLDQVRGLSPQTCLEYEKTLRYFVQWAKEQENLELRWSTVRKEDIDKWTAQMSVDGIAPRTIKMRISVLRTFFSWLCYNKGLKENPARFCQTPKAAQKLPREADTSKIDAWLSKPARTKEEAGVKMLTALMLDTGMRIGEVLALRRSDFQKLGIIVKGKGNKERVVFYGQRTIDSLRTYAPAGDEIFAGWTQTHIRYAMYRTLGKEVPRVYPHMLRHTFAMEHLNKGMAINEVSQLLGHAQVTTTQIYARAANATLYKHYQQINSLP